MHIRVTNPKITASTDSINFSVDIAKEDVESFKSNLEHIMRSNVLYMSLERFYDKRSLNANAMFWSLCQRLASAVSCSNEEMYLMLLHRYGVAEIVTTDISMATDMREMLTKHYRIVEELGEVLIDGRESYQFLCYKGSHEYNTAQMSRLIEGTLQECIDINIPVESKAVTEEAISKWKSEKPD